MRVFVLLLAGACQPSGHPQVPPPVGHHDITIWPSHVEPGSTMRVESFGTAYAGDAMLYGGRMGPGPCSPSGLCAELVAPRLLASATANTSRYATLDVQVPPQAAVGSQISLQVFSAAAGGQTSAVHDVKVSEPGCHLVDPTAADYIQREAAFRDNACVTSADCFVGGCNSETCSAEPPSTTSCPTTPPVPTDSCGCVDNQCVWYDPTVCTEQ